MYGRSVGAVSAFDILLSAPERNAERDDNAPSSEPADLLSASADGRGVLLVLPPGGVAEVNDEVAVVRGHAVAEPDRPMVCQLTMLRRRPRKKMKSDFLPESDTAMSKVSVR